MNILQSQRHPIAPPAPKERTTLDRLLAQKGEAGIGKEMQAMARRENAGHGKVYNCGVKARAKQQAKDIQAFWAKRGHSIHAWIEYRGKDSGGNPVWAVQTSLKNGMPK